MQHGLGGERVLVHRPGEVGVEQTLLHGLQVRLAAAQVLQPLLPHQRLVLARLDELIAEPLARVIVFDPQRFQVRQDRRLELLLPPADGRVVLVGIDVGASVVDVLADAAVLLVGAADAFGGDPEAAVAADEHARGQVVVDLGGAAVLLLEQFLAVLEGLLVDDRLVLADEVLAPELDQPGVVRVVEDVRDGGAVESRLAGPEDEALALHLVADLLEGHGAGGVELEDAPHGPGVLRVRLHGALAVGGHVDVPIGGEARRPTLADALLDALEHLLPQVVRVVLGDGGHDVERQRPGRPGSELVLDERELDALLVFEFLHPHRVAHVAADAVELVGEDDGDLMLAGVGDDPLEHLVERDAFGPALGRLGHDELTDDVPAFALGLSFQGHWLRVETLSTSCLPCSARYSARYLGPTLRRSLHLRHRCAALLGQRRSAQPMCGACVFSGSHLLGRASSPTSGKQRVSASRITSDPPHTNPNPLENR